MKKRPQVWAIVAVTTTGRAPLKITDKEPTRSAITEVARHLVEDGFYESNVGRATVMAQQVVSIVGEPIDPHDHPEARSRWVAPPRRASRW